MNKSTLPSAGLVADPGLAAPQDVGTASGRRYAKGVILCVVATVLMGAMFPVMTSALTLVDPFTFTSLRYLVAGTIFVVAMALTEGADAFRLNRRQLILAWFLGSLGFGGFGAFVFLGQQLAGPQGALTASIMMATQPMLGLLLNSLARRAMPPIFSFVFILMSFAGVALVITRGDLGALLSTPGSYSADGLIVLGASCWVVYTFSGSLFKNWSALRYTATTCCLGLTSIIGLNVVLCVLNVVPTPTGRNVIAVVPHLLYMGPVAGFLAILLWNMGNRILTPLNGVLFMDIVPLTTFVVSSIFGVVPGRMQTAGACLTCLALVLNNLYLRRFLRRPVAIKG